jgi:hypothetical protein
MGFVLVLLIVLVIGLENEYDNGNDLAYRWFGPGTKKRPAEKDPPAA